MDIHSIKENVIIRLNEYTGVEKSVLQTCTFDELGLDSSIVVGFIADISEQYDIELGCDLMYELDNVDQLTCSIHELVSDARVETS